MATHTLGFLPGTSQGQRNLAGYSPWGHRESDSTEHTRTQGESYPFNTTNKNVPSSLSPAGQVLLL